MTRRDRACLRKSPSCPSIIRLARSGGFFTENAGDILEEARQGQRLKMIELGAGTATKTGLLLRAAVRCQNHVVYVPIDVSAAALDEAAQRIQEEMPGVTVLPHVADYTCGLPVSQEVADEKRLVLYIGSSIGNFEPLAARELLGEVRRQLTPGDSLLLGVDMVKANRCWCRRIRTRRG